MFCLHQYYPSKHSNFPHGDKPTIAKPQIGESTNVWALVEVLVIYSEVNMQKPITDARTTYKDMIITNKS
jgi:hypothetical protein